MRSMGKEAGLTPADLKRFWSKVEVRGDSECWPWLGSRSRKYGNMSVGRTSVLAHRVSFTVARGAIPVGMVIDHTCHVEHCVNPAHLQMVTQAQNTENLRVARNSPTGIRGVTWRADIGRWRARVQKFGTLYSAGDFRRIEDAEAAVIALRAKLYTNSGDTKLGMA
jgi:hypothetical protein